jgi:hypothetical protein
MTSTLDTTQAGPSLANQMLGNPEMKNLLKDQKLDLKVFLHLQKSDFTSFKAEQDVKLKEWESKEKKERHNFFGEHPAGAERRVYIQDFMRRRDELLHQIAVDKVDKIKDQNEKLRLFRVDQQKKVEELTAKLKGAKNE